MDLLELIIVALIKMFGPPKDQQRARANQLEAVRQESDVLVARMPPPVRQAVRQNVRQSALPTKPIAARAAGNFVSRITPPQKRATRPTKRAMLPPVPSRPPVVKPLPAPPPLPRAKPAVAIHHTGIETSTRWLSHASLRTAIVASEILQPPLSLRE